VAPCDMRLGVGLARPYGDGRRVARLVTVYNPHVFTIKPHSFARRAWPAAAIGLLLGVAPALAELRPEQLLLVYNADLPASRELVQRYINVRGVPAGQVCGLHVDARAEEISAADFERSIRQPIRAFLEQNHLRDRVRCLVTFYGLPIRVADQVPVPDADHKLEDLRRQFLAALDELDRAADGMQSVYGAKPAAPSPHAPTEKDYLALLQRAGTAVAAAGARAVQPASSPEDAQRAGKFMELLTAIEGQLGVVRRLRPSGSGNQEDAQAQLAAVREQALQAEAQIDKALSRPAGDATRPTTYKVVRLYRGLVGLLRVLQADMATLRSEDTKAAVDSELALLWWDNYPRYRWVPNALNWRNRAETQLRRQLPAEDSMRPVLMVSRLDAGAPEIVRRMIDDSVAVEGKGLAGNVYIDARGMEAGKPGYGEYDQDLRDLSAMLQKDTRLSVRLDNVDAVFEVGSCPNAMLYCGWYSLRKYVDAFGTLVPGAVAFHIGSFEAISLKTPGERGWCKNLLEHGAAATLGPVAEPYLQSFPRPEEFFGLLLTGRFTLAEAYAYTNPMNSWMQMLLGDPLYRPFAKDPQLRIEQVFSAERIPQEFRPATAPATQP
jgi:uncharacterized protein (TIGR03790 family)